MRSLAKIPIGSTPGGRRVVLHIGWPLTNLPLRNYVTCPSIRSSSSRFATSIREFSRRKCCLIPVTARSFITHALYAPNYYFWSTSGNCILKSRPYPRSRFINNFWDVSDTPIGRQIDRIYSISEYHSCFTRINLG